MSARFTVLASGSSGNASLLEFYGFGLLIDCGLGPRTITERLSAIGTSWKSISAVLITHTHRDHWNAFTLAQLRGLNIPLIAHQRHHDQLSVYPAHDPIRKAGLTREYAEDRWYDLCPGLACLPVTVPHDADPTFAFRFEAMAGAAGCDWALGFASDLGQADDKLLSAFAGVDVLAVEFNHDVAMQKASRRPALLIKRVLGDAGHLSNDQAGEFARRIAESAGGAGIQAVVQLHLSRQCNRPELAFRAGRSALAESAPDAQVITTSQFTPTAPLTIERRSNRVTRPVTSVPPIRRFIQMQLPGLGPA